MSKSKYCNNTGTFLQIETRYHNPNFDKFNVFITIQKKKKLSEKHEQHVILLILQQNYKYNEDH